MIEEGPRGARPNAELEFYARAGIPAPAVLRIATLGAADIADVAGEVGAVVPGLRAAATAPRD